MFEYNTVEEAVKDLQDGKLILVSDDESRENEGDLICAAEFATTENVNFMATYGKGLICMPMSGDLCRKLGLTQMVADNTDNHETAFTVSIDHVKTTTGISAEERGFTARACVSDEAKPEDFRRPGHMFPLRSKPNGVLERNGHTEATVDLMRIAGLKECGLCCEIMKADGTMMRKEDLIEMSEKFNLKFITIKAIQEYRKRHDNLLPAAKFAVSYFVLIPHKNCDEELKSAIEERKGELNSVYDLVVSNKQKPVGIMAAVISDNQILAYTSAAKADKNLFETSVKEFLKNEKLTCAVLLYKDKDTYLEKVKNAALNFDVSKENSLDRKQYITDALLRMSM